MATPARPVLDRRRSSSRNRDAQRSVPTSPVGSPPQLQSILKRHPADQERRTGIDGPASPGTGGVEGGIASLAVGDSSAEALSAETSGRDTPASVATTVDSKTGFIRRVAFNTFDAGEELEGKAKATGGGTGIHYSFTLSAKSANYCRKYSVNATNWLLTSFLEDNDEVVVLRVIEPGSSAHNAWRASMEEAKDEAESVLAYLLKKNGNHRPISVIVEFAIGPIEETIHRMIEIYKPDSLIVGTRGRPDSLFKSAFMGSISRWAVARSPVPVVVVRPDDKVREALERRLQDQKRGRSYVSLLSEKERKQLNQSQVSVKVTPVQEVSRAISPTPRPSTQSSSLSATNGAPLERTVTAPTSDDRSDDKEEDPRAGAAPARTTSSKGNSSSGSGGGLMAALGFGKKKDKGKEFKRFGTFS
ncbi:usp (universal stress protein) family protein [Rhodotorula toruloides]|uniref:Usp (Universal stress protein) family protein n=1 Tax=Rhodotorula toruloides TaxID=5286 RepID=A0A511KIX0_RHOTO|nr:usp (universal stress protein) family protein [Rhodotorula toruloides]